MLVSNEVVRSARSRHARRIVFIQSQHHTSTLPRRASLSEVPSGELRGEPGLSPGINADVSVKLCPGGSCHLENELNASIGQLLTPQNENAPSADSAADSEPNFLFHDRATTKAQKPMKKKAVKPLHHIVKTINPVIHKPFKLIKPIKKPPPILKAPIAIKPTAAISAKPASILANPAKPAVQAPAPATVVPIKPLTQTPIKPSPPASQRPPVAAPPAHSPAKTNVPVYAVVPAVNHPAPLLNSTHPLPVASPHNHTAALPIVSAHAVIPSQGSDNTLSVPQTSRGSSVAHTAALSSNLKEIKSSPPEASGITPTQALQAQITDLPAVEGEGSQTPYSPEPEDSISTEDSSILPADSIPSEDSTTPSDVTSQDSATPITDSVTSASSATPFPQETVQTANDPLPSTGDNTSTGTQPLSAINIQTVNTNVPQQPSPLMNATLDSVTNSTALNNNTLNNATALTNATSLANNLHGLKLGNTPPNVFAAGPTNHTGAAVGGVFGSLALIALALGAFLFASRRRAAKKVDQGFGTFTEAPSTESPPEMTQVNSQAGFDVSSDSPESAMSPVDPVTRFSLGGVTLLKRLEGLTATFNSSDDLASPNESSSDDEPDEMVVTPSSDGFGPRPLSTTEQKHVSDHNPLSLTPSTMLDTSAPEGEDSRRSLLRSDSAGTVDNFNRESGGTATSYDGAVSNGYQETVKFEDGSEQGHEESAKDDMEQPWWGSEQPRAT
ncbi:hypothetical protein PGT21_016356 [Puccinia graminis f. sp. tritici]|uniref:Uncharacterized protein n=1 Tax=Puccinia graminis f. sp. tritici TaxID=56615 RepID=A0A5B0QAZ7_PUCGR|nr:hypothetical protein PGT21_016356 [Puccinia graminis f. sp. tritici]